MTKLHIGNLSGQITDSGLEEIFTRKGFQVTSARVICDREGGRSRGFGFVELGSSVEAARAITETNGLDVDGRALQVNEARPLEPRNGGCRTPGARVYSGGARERQRPPELLVARNARRGRVLIATDTK